ncbi:unnamed protein product [Diatraea saccharalis]|uniref:Pyrroline-5-carboxylate reductase n=1 Tax=Diatraea saccharalis TaxID=40085 RepID=A0A9N9R0S6_9NEOP|nr:unnamed protein product [Diatraea saccharalis]
MAFNLGFIGGGNMSTAIMNGILNKDGHPASKIWVSGPHLENLKYWQEKGANITIKNGEVYSECDYVFLGVKPALLEKSLQETVETIPRTATSRSVLIISMLAGIKIERLQMVMNMHKLLNNSKVARIMPNVPMAVGSGACLFTCGDNVSEEQKEKLSKLLKCCGHCEEIPEALMNNLGVLTACGPAYIFVIIEALADGAVKQGVPRDLALRFAAQMVMGSAHLVFDSKKHPGQLKDEVCSPGGSTICGISVLEDGKIRSTLINAIEASVNKTKSFEMSSSFVIPSGCSHK